MGTDKALLIVEGEPLASRLGHILSLVAQPVVEVGPGWSGLDTVRENPSGSGPPQGSPPVVPDFASLVTMGGHL
jgi:hypothetical protein